MQQETRVQTSVRQNNRSDIRTTFFRMDIIYVVEII